MYRTAILADEMGLGKTVQVCSPPFEFDYVSSFIFNPWLVRVRFVLVYQAITYLTLLNHLHNDPGPHLIVCPASVLENWERELKKWCPSFSILQFHGAGRAAYCKELSSLSKAGLPPPFNVLLVCYSLFERHRFVCLYIDAISITVSNVNYIFIIYIHFSAQQKDDRKILKRWRWSCVLMDEAHALKDKNSFRWKNLMAVARNANQRLMLTGTPLQNDLHVWILFEWMSLLQSGLFSHLAISYYWTKQPFAYIKGVICVRKLGLREEGREGEGLVYTFPLLWGFVKRGEGNDNIS